MMGGACDGGAFVQRTFEGQMYGSCRGCHFVEDSERGRECQVLEGRDTCVQCPELQDYLRYNEIRLYGVNADIRIENPKKRKKARR